MQKLKAVLSLGFLVFTLLAASSLIESSQAQQGVEPIEDEVIEEAVAVPEEILFAIQSIILSLEAQNAPVPHELMEILELGSVAQSAEGMQIFEQEARQYFGERWQEQLLQDASVLSAKEASLLVRSRIYLSSLIANADQIALRSPLNADEIEEIAADLLADLRKVNGERDKFFLSFGVANREIFPEKDTDDLTHFREEVTRLLAELADAIAILIDGRKRDALESDLADLQSRLQLIDETQKLTAWLARFDAFARKLLTHAIPAKFSVLTADLNALLKNLSVYIQALQKNDIDTGTYPERIAELQDELRMIQTDDQLDDFFGKLEDMINSVTETFTPVPEEPDA